MPGIVKVKVLEGRNLPVMDKSADTTDAYVEIKLGNITYKTDVCRKSLNPQWNSEWYRFEMDDAELQDEPLQVRLMDHDTYSANDMIGKVYFNLNPLLLNSSNDASLIKSSHSSSPGSGCISGWFPVYDTIHGLRGEINLIIRLELFSDFNKFRQSSCGIHVFSCSMIPYGYYSENIYGFVEELVVEDDPEYQWIEKIRTPRASNEARQAMFYKMSGEVQRKIGLKVIELGGNAVIGYRQYFDLEGETGGVVVRGIGTAVKLNKYKQFENLNRTSFPANFLFPIPNLTVTSSFANNASHGDNYSVVSFSESLRSDFTSEFAAEDTWSLCSFGSRTSCNSRYTSIETLLDQENRKRSAKSGSKLLSVARYFTTSKMRRKFSRKKKQKSLKALRKFSVIEEYKQKSSGNLGAEIDEMMGVSGGRYDLVSGESSVEQYKRSNGNLVEMMGASGDRYAQLPEASSVEEYKQQICENLSAEADQMMGTCGSPYDQVSGASYVEECKGNSGANLYAEIDEIMGTSGTAYKQVPRAPSVEEYVSCQIYEDSASCRMRYFDVSGATVNLKNTEQYPRLKDELVFQLDEENDGESRTKVIEEVEKCMVNDCNVLDDERTSNDVSSLNEFSFHLVEKTDERDLSTTMTNEVERMESTSPLDQSDADDSRGERGGFIRRRTPPISEMSPVSMSPPSPVLPEVKKFISERDLKNVGFEKSFLKKLRRSEVPDYYPLASSPEIKRIIRRREELKRSRSENTVCTSRIDTSTPSFRPLCQFASISDRSSSPSSCPSPVPDAFDGTNAHLDITSADIHCNVLPEALTPTSRLLTHANNPDRITSECDKECDDNNTPAATVTAKRESLPTVEALSKKRSSLPDTSAFSKSNDVKDNVAAAVSAADIDESARSTNFASNLGSNIIHKENIDLMEYPFLTLSIYPEDFILHLGGTVSARSVKLLARISNIEEPETRDAWWTELRIEIKSHMRALACNVVLNYTEHTSICDEVCVLSASGTAALVRIYDGSCGSSLPEHIGAAKTSSMSTTKNADVESESKEKPSERPYADDSICSVYHIPYRKSSLPLPVKIKTCGLCKKGFVADVMFVTIEPFDRMPVIGQAAFIHAFVYRLKRDCKSELNAREISDGLPFLEYELNRQLVNKLRIKGMNALFGLNVQVAVGEKMISAYATGTAVLLSVLPAPPELTLVSMGRSLTQHPASKKKLTDARKLLEDTIKKNRIHYQLGELQNSGSDTTTKAASATNATASSDGNADQMQYPDIEYFAGSKQTCAIEVDDEDDLETIAQLIDPNPPQGFLVSATEKLIFGSLPYVPKKNIQMFTQVYRYRIPNNTPPSSFNKLFYRVVQGLYMKIHNRIPCSLNKVTFKMDIPEPDELQIRIVGMALALKESEKALESVSTSCSSFSELSDDVILNSSANEKDLEPIDALCTFTPRKQTTIKKHRYELLDSEIHITSLSYIPGTTVNLYLGNLNFVFIRESTMVKEQTGGVNNFVNNFLSDVTLIVKSHAAGIGGNAVVNFFVNECLLSTHSHKNQGQCLINVGGDVVRYVATARNYRSDLQ